MIKCKQLPSIEYLNECFEVDFEAGILMWKERPRKHFYSNQSWKRFNTIFAGKKVGWVNKIKHCKRVCINESNYLVHRIIFAMYKNNIEIAEQIDHKDNDGSLNNKITNLREATASNNKANQKIQKNNKSGYKGVYFHTRDKMYAAQINCNGRKYHLGYFNSAIEAARAYDRKALKLHGEFARTNFSFEEDSNVKS